MITDAIKIRLRALSVQRLAQVWCELNRWDWPVEFADIKPVSWRHPSDKPIVETLGWQLMEEARRILADKAISREWNRDEMTDEQFEAWIDLIKLSINALRQQNAALIAALEAFVAAEDWYREEIISHNPAAYNDPLADAYEQAKAALAKARQ